MNILKLGYAETDITPTVPVETIGFHRKDNVSRGILKPLLAQVTVWEAGELCCLITIDSIGFKTENVMKYEISLAKQEVCLLIK